MPPWLLKYKVPIGVGAVIVLILFFVGFYAGGGRKQEVKISPTPISAAPSDTPTPSPTGEPTITPKPTLKPTATATPKPTSTPTPTNTPTHTPITFSVTGATAAVSPTSFNGVCPKKFDFTANITANAAGTVTYKWTRSDGASGATGTIVFASAGTHATSGDDWTLGGPGFTYSGWEKVQILTPNATESNQASFSLTCL